MKIKMAIVAGLLCAAGVAEAVDSQEIVDAAESNFNRPAF